MINIRLPNITASGERDQILQMRSYLYQLAEQLNIELNGAASTESERSALQYAKGTALSGYRSGGGSSGAQDAEATFSQIKSLIIKSADIVDAYYSEINERLAGRYVAESDFGTYKEETELKFNASAEEISNTMSKVATVESDLGDYKKEAESKFVINSEEVQTKLRKVTDIETDLGTFKATTESQFKQTAEEISARFTEDQLGDYMKTYEIDVYIDGVKQTFGSMASNLATAKSNAEDAKSDAAIADEKAEAAKTNAEAAKKDAAEAKNQVTTISAYINTGLLCTEASGEEIYGVEVGQTSTDGTKKFSPFARFTATKLAFFDSTGSEVAYISNQKLYITQAEVINQFVIGSLESQVDDRGDVVKKYIGGKT